MTAVAPDARIDCRADDGFQSWMAEARGSLAVTTYQAGKVVMLGWDGRQTTVLPRHFAKPMGLAVKGQRLVLATRHEVSVFANAPLLAPSYLEDQPGKYDALFLPRLSYHTGDLNVHDLGFGAEGLWFVNTRFSCLAGPSDEFCFKPQWQPRFISQLAPEDRCHLNGLAMIEGKPRYVSALGTTDSVGGWRENKAAGGILIDVPSNEIVLRGLCMPHSPRWHEGRLWFVNSGAGELCVADLDQGRFSVVCTLPGYLRGLSFAGSYALVGLGQIREKHIFGGLPIQERFGTLQCGIAVIDLKTGRQCGFFEFTAGCQELFEVQFLPGWRRPMILNLEKEAVREAFPAPGFAYWLRASNEMPPNGVSQQSPAANGVQELAE